MKKFIIIIFILGLCFSSIAYAKQPIAPALEWWLTGQGAFQGATVKTKGNEITKWVVPGIPQPDDAEIDVILVNYNVYIASEEAQYQANLALLKANLKQNKGLSDAEIDILLKDK